METTKPYALKIRVSTDFAEDGLKEFIKSEYPTAHGYLLSADEAERQKNQYACTIFFVDKGSIVITDTMTIIESAVIYFIKLNNHARYTGYKLGYNNDDFIQNRITAKVDFKFNQLQKS